MEPEDLNACTFKIMFKTCLHFLLPCTLNVTTSLSTTMSDIVLHCTSVLLFSTVYLRCEIAILYICFSRDPDVASTLSIHCPQYKHPFSSAIRDITGVQEGSVGEWSYDGLLLLCLCSSCKPHHHYNTAVPKHDKQPTTS